MSAVKWVSFETQPTTGKTSSVDVKTVSNIPIPLGNIRWFGAVRSYVFYPEDGVFFTPDSLQEITAKVTELMDERQKEKEGA